MGILKNLRRFAYRSQYVFAPILNHDRPVDVSLELASTCNQSCGYCYHADKANLPFRTGFMNIKLAQLIIVDSAELQVPSIKFNYRGESTLHREFKEITAFAKDHADKKTFIDRLTNSNFKFDIEREDIFEGLCNQTKVKVSFDSFIPGVMEMQRAGSNRIKAMNNITKFHDHPKRKNTELVIQAVRTNLNKDEDIEGTVKNRWPDAKVSIHDMVAGRVKSEKADSLLKRDRDDTERKSCIQAHARLIFNHDGKAQMCCPDIGSKLVVGSILEQSVYQIFNSKKAKEIRTRLKTGSAFNMDPCKTCSSFESYKGFKPSWES